jgi:hypothetical protein
MLVSASQSDGIAMGAKTEKKSKTSGREHTAAELSDRIWSVVSFDKVEAAGLTYAEARDKMEERAAAGGAGLCIVTDSAASRMSR